MAGFALQGSGMLDSVSVPILESKDACGREKEFGEKG